MLALLAAGCQFFAPRAPRPVSLRKQVRLTRFAPSRLTKAQREFAGRLFSLPRESEERRKFLASERWPGLGPRSGQLRELAVAKTVELNEGMLLGCDRIVVAVPVTPGLLRAVRELKSRASVLRVPAAEIDARRSGEKRVARIRVERVSYYVRGTCAIARTVIRQGTAWSGIQNIAFALVENRWVPLDVEDGRKGAR